MKLINRNLILKKHLIQQDQLMVCKQCIFMVIIDYQVHLKNKEYQQKQSSKMIAKKRPIQLIFLLFRIMSEDEKFDDQLKNGTDYINLPADRFPTDQAPTWIRKSRKKNRNS